MNGIHIYDPAEKDGQKFSRRQFYQKLHTEYLAYEQDVCRKEAADVFYLAPKIVPVMKMYEHLLATAVSLPDDWLKVLCGQDKLIKACCTFWKNNRDWTVEEAADLFISELWRNWRDAA